MRKLLMVVIAVFIGISGTASSVECPEDAVLVGLTQHDVPISEMDTQVVDVCAFVGLPRTIGPTV